MYVLQSGGRNNAEYAGLAEMYPEKANHLTLSMSMERVANLVFDHMDEPRMRKNVGVALTLGDQLPIPMRKQTADVLWFAFLVNTNDGSSVRIKNLQQAYTLYGLYENDYTKVELAEESDRLRFSMMDHVQHGFLFPGFQVSWKLPVSFFRRDGVTYATLSGNSYALFRLDCMERTGDGWVKVPRAVYLRFLQHAMTQGRLICTDTEAIKNAFDLNNADAGKCLLEYLGYQPRADLTNIEVPIGNAFIHHGKVAVAPRNADVPLYWTSEGPLLVLLPRADYIPWVVNGHPEAVTALMA